MTQQDLIEYYAVYFSLLFAGLGLIFYVFIVRPGKRLDRDLREERERLDREKAHRPAE